MSGKENDFTSIASNISETAIKNSGVQALADRPNLTGQYGTAGLSGTALKLHFDKLATAIARRVNDIIKNLASTDAGKCIRVNLDDVKIYTLNGLVESFNDGTFASNVLQLKANQSTDDNTPLQDIINGIASTIVTQRGLIETANSNISAQGTSITTLQGVVDDLSGKWKDMETSVENTIKNIAEDFAITPDDIAKLLTDEKIANAVETYVKLDTITGVSGSLAVTQDEKSSWNAKAELSDIPANVSQLTNDKNYVTASDITLSNLGAMPAGVTINGVETTTATDENGITTTSFSLRLEDFDSVNTNATSTDKTAADNINTALTNAANAATAASEAKTAAATAQSTASEAKTKADEAKTKADEVEKKLEDATGGATVEDIEAGVTLGYITKGTTIDAGTTLEEFITMLVAPDLIPQTKLPYTYGVALTSNNNQVNEYYEVGETLTGLKVTANYDDGEYYYADGTKTTDTGAKVTQWYVDDAAVDWDVSKNQKEMTWNLGDLTITDNTEYSVSVKAAHKAGTTPTMSKSQKEYTDAQIKAGTTSSTRSRAIKGYRAWFAGASSEWPRNGENVDFEKITSDVIRSLNNQNAFSGNETVTLESYTGAKSFIVAVPKDKVTKFTAFTSSNVDTTKAYSKGIVYVADKAGKNETEYDVWVYAPDNLSETTVHNITLK